MNGAEGNSAAFDARSGARHAAGRAARAWRQLARTLFGLALLVAVLAIGWKPLHGQLPAAGWPLLSVLPLHVLADAIDSLGWRALLKRHRRPSAAYLIWAALLRDAVGSLLPVVGAAAPLIGADLLRARGIRFLPAFASIVVESSLSLLSQALFVLAAGYACMLALGRNRPLELMGLPALLTLAAGAAFLLLQRYRAAYLWLMRNGARLPFAARYASALPVRFYACLRRIHARPLGLWVCTAWQLLALAVGALELWLMLHLLGYHTGLAVPFLLQAASKLSRSLGFAVPANLGVQEGVFAAVAASCGLPAAIGLSLSLLSRFRDLLLGGPVLLAWWLRRSAISSDDRRRGRIRLPQP